MRRVVVTGMGMLSPLGRGVETNWERLIKGENGFKRIDRFEVDDLAAQIAAMIPMGTEAGQFDPDSVAPAKERRRMDDFIVYGLAAAMDAVEDSGWKPEDEESRARTGVMIGSGIGGLKSIYDCADTLLKSGPRRVSPFFIPSSLINLVSGHVSIKYGFTGPNHSAVTACATGAHAIGDASRLIQFGDADVMLAGGAESAICRIGIAGFASAKALSTNYNDRPSEGSRPWDKGRDGFVMGEGSGVLVLEEYEHAKARGAKIYAEIKGYGLSGDAHHITAPHPEGRGAIAAMKMALKNAGMNPEDIDYINAHGTSTPLGDEIECASVKKTFGEAAYKLSMSSTKSSVGHLLGAAGAVESIYSICALNSGVVPPTLNLHDPSEGCDIDLVPLQAKEREVRAVQCNSFGFGGTNASLVMTKV